GASDRLADPPRRIRGELEAAAVLEPVHRLHEPDVSLLDEVQQAQIAAQIALGDGHHEAKVCLHQFLLRLAHLAIAASDLDQQRLELAARQADLALEMADLAGHDLALAT